MLFLEIRPGDASQFSEVLKVQGVEVAGYRVLRCQSPAIPNAIAALLLYIRDQTGQIPHVYFGWTEGNPITYLLEVPGVRRGRHGAGHPRSPAPVRARSAAAPARPRRVNDRRSDGDLGIGASGPTCRSVPLISSELSPT